MVKVIVGTLAAILAAILQSSLAAIGVAGIRIDLVLIVLIFIAFRNGDIAGQTAGFFCGLTEDALSLSPPGFHAAVRTAIGFVYGKLKDRTIMKPIVLPIILCGTGSIIKFILMALIALIFSLNGVIVSLFSWRTLVEIGLTTLCAPLLFSLLRLLPRSSSGMVR